MNDTKKTAIVFSLTFAVIIIVMLILIPVEKKKQFYAEWGNLAVLSETNERVRYIIENEELYPETMIKILRSNPEKNLEFVYNYPFHKDDYQTMSYTAEELDGRTPALYMDDFRWAYQTFYDSYAVKDGGCALVSLTMAYIGLTGKTDLDPYKILLIADDIDAVGVLGGISDDKTMDMINAIGLNAVEYSFIDENKQKSKQADLQTMKSILDSGHLIMTGMVGETFGRHAFIIRGYEGDSFYINDPGSEENSSRLWSYEEIEPEMYYMWDLSA